MIQIVILNGKYEKLSQLEVGELTEINLTNVLKMIDPKNNLIESDFLPDLLY
jgi:hypothetical protein